MNMNIVIVPRSPCYFYFTFFLKSKGGLRSSDYLFFGSGANTKRPLQQKQTKTKMPYGTLPLVKVNNKHVCE